MPRYLRLMMAFAAVAITGLGSVVAAENSSAHGYVGTPISRSYACQQGLNTGCGPVQFEPQSVEGPKGFPQSGPADGAIASANGRFPELDAQTSSRWYKTQISSGPREFKWSFTAAHSTAKWHYYITRQGWNQNAALTRASLELIGTVMHDNSPASTNPNHVINIPTNRTGYHVILGVWDIADTGNAFYSAVDVNVAGQSVPDTQPPTAASSLAASGITNSAATLTWQAATDNVSVTGYRVYRNGTQVGTPTGTSFSDSGLSPGAQYTYVVRAVDAAGNVSGPSNQVVVTTLQSPTPDTQAPSAPSGLHSMGTTSNSVSLMWSPATDNVGVVGYVVYRNGVQVGTPTTTSYEDRGLAAGTKYTYVVRAIDAAANRSAASNTLTATTATAPGSYPTWSSTKQYARGDRVTHLGKTYQCVQGYQGHGDPNWINAGSLWARI